MEQFKLQQREQFIRDRTVQTTTTMTVHQEWNRSNHNMNSSEGTEQFKLQYEQMMRDETVQTTI